MTTPLHPEFVQSMASMLSGTAEAFFAALEDAPALAMRVNSFRAAAMDSAREFISDAVPWSPWGYYLKPDVRPGLAIAHASGAYYLQEASAMAPAAVLAPKPGERVLDLCAAPGGKSGMLAAYLNGTGLLVCNEPEPSRAKMLAGNLERMGVKNAMVVNAYPDAVAAAFPEFFDAVLVDAPCSGEGMFRRDPDSRLQWQPGSPEGCAKRQCEILRQAAKTVRPGGRIVYSTCTFNALENEGVIKTFLAEHSDFTSVDFSLPSIGDSVGGCIRVMPHLVRGDGQFAALLIRGGDSRASVVPRSAPAIPSLDAALSDLLADPSLFSSYSLTQIGQKIYAMPPEMTSIPRLRVVSPGLCLFRVEKNRLEPEHSLAMALEPADARRIADLDLNLARLYLAGEAIPFESASGWVLAVHRGLPLGWAKSSGGILKNHLPKGLRLR